MPEGFETRKRRNALTKATRQSILTKHEMDAELSEDIVSIGNVEEDNELSIEDSIDSQESEIVSKEKISIGKEDDAYQEMPR